MKMRLVAHPSAHGRCRDDRAGGRVLLSGSKACALIVGMCLGAPGAAPADPPAEESVPTHQHGAGILAIAAVDTELFIELQLPAVDVVGFEHDPETSKERKKLEQAVRTLERGTTLFEPDAGGQCDLVDVSAGHQMEGAGGTDEDPGWVENEDQEVNPFGESALLGEDETHTEFLVTYAFACKALPDLKSVKVNLFESFPSVTRVTGVFISEETQQKFSVTPDAPEINVER